MSRPAQETYDRLAPIYDTRWERYTRQTLRVTLEGLHPRPDDRILDLGTGTGELARHALDRWPALSVIGLDLSRAMLHVGRSKPIAGDYRVVQGTADRLPFPDHAFEGVASASSFQHFHAPDRVLAEVFRVLRPGGWFLLTAWCDDYLSCKVCSLYLRWTDPSFHRSYTLAECGRRLISAGFEIPDSRRIKIDWLWGLMRFEAIRPSSRPESCSRT